MNYVYGKIKNIKFTNANNAKKESNQNTNNLLTFKVESDWKIIDYENENNILSLYCDNNNLYDPYNEKIVIFKINYSNDEKIVDFLINNIHEHYKIEFEKLDVSTNTIEVSSLEIINE